MSGSLAWAGCLCFMVALMAVGNHPGVARWGTIAGGALLWAAWSSQKKNREEES